MIGAFFPLVIRRMVAYAPLLAPVLIGTLIATAITSGIVIYGEALRNVGLTHALSKTNSEATDLRLRFETPGAGAAARNQSVGLVEIEVARWLGGLAGDPTRYTRSDTFLLSRPGEPPGDLSTAPRGSFHVLSDAERRFELVDGRWPSAGSTDDPDQTLGVEAVALESGAEALGLSVGDGVAFSPFWEDITPRVDVQLTGIVRIRDPLDPIWSIAPFSRLSADPTLLNTLPVVVAEEVLVSVLGVAFPEMGVSHLWTYPLKTDELRASDTTDVVARLRSLEVALSSRVRAFRQETALTSVLSSYDTRLRFIQVPLAIVLLLVEAMVLYAVAFLATLAMERQRADAALVRSRGAHTSQVFYLYAAQGVLISAVATIFGPILAAVAVSSFGYFPAFVSFTQGAPIAVSLSPAAFLFAAVGGALSLGVFLTASLQIARRNPLEERRQSTRPLRVSMLQRYYLDVGLAGMVSVLLWQLGQQGSLISSAVSGQGSADLLLLFIPTLFLVSTALIVLRLFPVAIGGVARLIGPIAPVWLALGLWQIGRNPIGATRLVLLLVLGAGLGAFAASFGGTLDRSYQDRAFYEAGAQVRLDGIAMVQPGPSRDIESELGAAPDVETVSLVLRQNGSFAAAATPKRFALLGVAPDRFPDVVWWRDDFATTDAASVLAPLRQDSAVPWGVALPADAEAIGLWLRAPQSSPESLASVLLVDANLRYYAVTLGTLESTEWVHHQVSLAPQAVRSFGRLTAQFKPLAPIRLLSIQIRQRARSEGMTGGAVFLDELTTTNGVGETTSVLNFHEAAGRWAPLDVGSLSRGDSLRVVPAAGRAETPAFLFTWAATSGFVQRGMYAGPIEARLAVLVSPSVLRATGQRVGDSIGLATGAGPVPVTIVGTVDYVPTLDPAEGAGFILANRDDLVRHQNLVGQQGEVQPSEAWMTLSSADLTPAILEGLRSVAPSGTLVDRAALEATSNADPLVAAGWGALLFVAYGGVVLLGVVGFIAHAVLSVSERSAQFALLRTLGLGGRQIKALVWFEHLVVIVVGVAVGFFLGQRTGALLMPFLDRTEEGIAVLPPYVTETNWASLGAVYGLMVVVFFAATYVVVRLYSKLALGQALRIGEE